MMIMAMIHRFSRKKAAPPIDANHFVMKPGAFISSVPITASTVWRMTCGISISSTVTSREQRIVKIKKRMQPFRKWPSIDSFV